MRTVLLFLIFIVSFSTKAQVEVKPDDRDEFALRANYEFNNNNWQIGKSILDEGMNKYPKDTDLKMLLGKYYFHFEDYEKSRYELIKALELNPDNVDAKQIMVNVEMATGRYSSAICYVNELLEVNPYWKGLWRKKIELFQLQGNSVEAGRLLKRINQIYPQDTLLLQDYLYEVEMLAINSTKDGQFEDAIAHRKELLRAEPSNTQHYVKLSNDYRKSGDINNALSTIERGLTYSPGDLDLILIKVGILSDALRYNELLVFLQQQLTENNSPILQRHYNYHLMQAARNARENEPSTLYSKILTTNPNNFEAFNYMYNYLLQNHQYEEALHLLNNFKDNVGSSKELSLREISLYKRMGNTGRALNIARELFFEDVEDEDLREEYSLLEAEVAKNNMRDERYIIALEHFKEVVEYGNDELRAEALKSIYDVSIKLSDFSTAMNAINRIIIDEPFDHNHYVKRSDLYFRMELYNNAFEAYEEALSISTDEERVRHLGGLSDQATKVIKSLSEEYKFDDAIQYTSRWLEIDPTNIQALKYAVNISNQMNDRASMLRYAQIGMDSHPDNPFFIVKMGEYKSLNPDNYDELYEDLSLELNKHPYHEELINVFSFLSENYANQHIKEGSSKNGLEILDKALIHDPDNRSLKYLKGVAFEKLQVPDSAYYYQSFYEPSLLELQEFKQYLSYLNYKRHKNEVSVHHLRSRPGHLDVISTISTVEYTRFEENDTYIGRINYTGRDAGKGYQLQGEWNHTINEMTNFTVDLAFANKFFPIVAFNAKIYKALKNFEGYGLDLRLGYKYMPDSKTFNILNSNNIIEKRSYSTLENQHLTNIVAGLTKEIDQWRFNLRFHNYFLSSLSSYRETSYDIENELEVDDLSESGKSLKWLYNISAQTRYYLSSPKNYLIAMAGVGTAPDVELLNYQLMDRNWVLNTMVGIGIAHMITDTFSASIMGTSYNFPIEVNNNYRNLYNIYFSLNVVF